MAVTTRLKAAVYVLAVLGFYGTWGRTILDGTLMRLFTALHYDERHLMSGTNEPLLTIITGVYWPIDYLLDVLILFFWEATDGSHPSTTLVALYFAGQHLSIAVVLYINSLRTGNRKEWKIGATLWLMLFQLTAVATSGPWFLAAYFSVSPLVDVNLPRARYLSSHLAEPRDILLVPISAMAGYIVPVILMSLRSPSVVPHTFKQLTIALWNVFPLTMIVFQKAAQSVLLFTRSAKRGDKAAASPDPAGFLRVVRICYAFSLIFSCACHIGVATVSGLSVFFPMIFAPNYSSGFRPGRLLIPPFSRTVASSFGEGDLGFMKWDQLIGYTCMLLYASMTYRQAQAKLGVRGSWRLYAGVMGGCMLVGPGSTVLAISWAMDELLFARKTDNPTSEDAGLDMKGSS